jgi:hypothetical protein
MDDYPTIDPNAITPLAPFLGNIKRFAEPCAGEGHLVRHLEAAGLVCGYSADIAAGWDALEAKGFGYIDAIITNPPWTRDILHRMIAHFQSIAPTWPLFDADWAHTKQSAPYINRCSHIVVVGRLRWIEGTKMKGKDNCAWHRFDINHSGGPHFVGWQESLAA